MAKIGESIGGWILREKLGRGGQGEVFLASREEGKAEAAIKLLNCKRPKKKSRFIQEVSVHVALSSQGTSNIIPILDHNLDELEDGGIKGYVVMPLAATTLEDQKELVRGRVELCLEIFRGVVTGVGHAHAAGVTHRDIKPANVLFLDPSLREPLVSDFGICLLKDTPDEKRLTVSGETVGAKFFMAPEQERGGIVDVLPAADIYALGKLLHFMLTGRNLYREAIEEAFNDEELRVDLRLLAIRDKILRASIVEEPRGRFQSTEELLQALDNLNVFAGTSPNNSTQTVSDASNQKGDDGSHPELSAYREYTNLLTSGGQDRVKLEFDSLQTDFSTAWQTVYQQFGDKPDEAPAAAEKLIQDQFKATALFLAVGRCDSKGLFRPIKIFLETLAKAGEGHAGYIATSSIPDLQAGFLYTALSLVAFAKESWNTLQFALTEKFVWYYQSGRPHYSYGFEHPDFFYPHPLGRKADKAHDFYQTLLAQDPIIQYLDLKGDILLNAYVQMQFLMSMRGIQLTEQVEPIPFWPDFGRFHDYRLSPLLDRMFHDNEYSMGILRSFRESRENFFERLNGRLKQLGEMYRSSNYWWESIRSWEPR
jgi:serine/threonine protein kinase